MSLWTCFSIPLSPMFDIVLRLCAIFRSISKPMPQVPRPDIPAGISPVERSRRLREQAAVAGRNNDQAGQSVTDPARQDQFRAQREEAILKRQKMEAAKNSCSRGSSG